MPRPPAQVGEESSRADNGVQTEKLFSLRLPLPLLSPCSLPPSRVNDLGTHERTSTAASCALRDATLLRFSSADRSESDLGFDNCHRVELQPGRLIRRWTTSTSSDCLLRSSLSGRHGQLPSGITSDNGRKVRNSLSAFDIFSSTRDCSLRYRCTDRPGEHPSTSTRRFLYATSILTRANTGRRPRSYGLPLLPSSFRYLCGPQGPHMCHSYYSASGSLADRQEIITRYYPQPAALRLTGEMPAVEPRLQLQPICQVSPDAQHSLDFRQCLLGYA